MERNNNKGFSMVELIITIAIMAILTGSFVAAAGYLKYANAKSGAKKINTELSELKLNNLSIERDANTVDFDEVVNEVTGEEKPEFE